MIFAAILAGGKGTRMKSATLPKQFLPLGDTPMLIYTINKFLSVSQIDKIYIGINPETTRSNLLAHIYQNLRARKSNL